MRCSRTARRLSAYCFICACCFDIRCCRSVIPLHGSFRKRAALKPTSCKRVRGTVKEVRWKRLSRSMRCGSVITRASRDHHLAILHPSQRRTPSLPGLDAPYWDSTAPVGDTRFAAGIHQKLQPFELFLTSYLFNAFPFLDPDVRRHEMSLCYFIQSHFLFLLLLHPNNYLRAVAGEPAVRNFSGCD